MAAIQYVLSVEENSKFHDDEFRVGLRSRLAKDYPEGVMIFSHENDLLDTISAETEGEVGLAVMLSDEEKDELEKTLELQNQEVDRTETVIRPLVESRIRSEVRSEYRNQIRVLTNEKLEMAAKMARLERDATASTFRLRQELSKASTELENQRNINTELLTQILQLQSGADESGEAEAK